MARAALIVEDDAPTGQYLADHLSQHQFAPTVLSRGALAIDWAREHQPDLIVLDQSHPDLKGYTACEALKLDRKTNLIPLIMITDQDEPVVHGLLVAANRYLARPFSAERLTTAIEEALAWRADLDGNGLTGEIDFRLQSRVTHLDKLLYLLTPLFRDNGLGEVQVKQLIIVVRELGTNAIEWGHRKQEERIVTVICRTYPDKVALIIRDTGPGFNPQQVPHAARSGDPLGHMSVRSSLGLREGGFGLLMVRGLVDDLQYNDKGNEVRFTKRLCHPQEV